MSKHTGGAAFPVTHDNGFTQEGMTLRDYFAAHCPITWEQAQDYNMSGNDEMASYCAMRLEYADAMLAERAK